jgi:hypothetical protein
MNQTGWLNQLPISFKILFMELDPLPPGSPPLKQVQYYFFLTANIHPHNNKTHTIPFITKQFIFYAKKVHYIIWPKQLSTRWFEAFSRTLLASPHSGEQTSRNPQRGSVSATLQVMASLSHPAT